MIQLRSAVVYVAVAAALAGCTSTTGKSGKTSKTAPKSTTVAVAKGAGSKDASADVTLGKFHTDPILPWEPVKVTNHSSKASIYIITIAAESKDGKTQLDTSIVSVDSLLPGQSSTQKAYFTKKLPAKFKLRLVSVQRTAS